MKKNLVNLAKSGKKSTVKKIVKKQPVKKNVKKLNDDEKRDIKAKETVAKLLEESPIITLDPKINEQTVPKEDLIPTIKGVDWLEDQVSLLTEKNNKLTVDLELAKSDYQKLLMNKGGNVGSDDLKVGLLKLFDELQENYIRMGVNPQTGIGNFTIYNPGFLNRLMKFFPFLVEMKRF